MSEQPVNFAGLLDHFVGAGEDYRGQLDPQRFGDAEVDPEIELGWTFERQLAWLCAFQNAIKLRDQLTKGIGKIGSVRHEAAIGDPVGRRKNRRLVAQADHPDDLGHVRVEYNVRDKHEYVKSGEDFRA